MTAVAIMNRNPTRRVSSSRARGSTATTAAPTAGTATIDVRIGNPTRPGRHSSSANNNACIIPDRPALGGYAAGPLGPPLAKARSCADPYEHDPAEQQHGA